MTTGTAPSAPRTAPERRRVRRAAVAGMVAPVLFVVVFTVEGWRRPGYDPRSMFVSELSLGPSGWVQIASFLVTGALLLVFGRGLATSLRDGPASTAGPVLLQVIGVSLMASGPFTTDPSALFDQVSVHGVVHGLFGAVVFALAPVTCLVFARRFRREAASRAMAVWTAVASVVLVAGIGVLKVSQSPSSALFGDKGLVQRVVLVTFMAWLFTVAVRTHRDVGAEGAARRA